MARKPYFFYELFPLAIYYCVYDAAEEYDDDVVDAVYMNEEKT